jgi:hypothetical protein
LAVVACLGVPHSGTAAGAAASGQDAADVKTFLQRVYAHYKKGSTFAPMEKDAKVVFDRAMIDLMARDAELQNPDEVGPIDGDWICGCQDFESISATIAVQSATGTIAKATADFKVFDQAHHNVFDLVKENGAWRVHDVVDTTITPPQPGLRKILEDDIAMLSKGRK